MKYLGIIKGGLLMGAFLILLAGCTKQVGRLEYFETPDIKDDFCGVIMNYQYCKCAFHNNFCDEIGLSQDAADIYVQTEYDKWVESLIANFKTACEAAAGKYRADDEACEYCDAPNSWQDDKCAKPDEIDSSEAELSGFKPDGPFNADCSIDEGRFENEWQKYSDLDDSLEVTSVSPEVQDFYSQQQQLGYLLMEKFVLEADMEVDKQMRLELRAYKDALVNNIKQNLIKSLMRLSFITYDTIGVTPLTGSGAKGLGKSYAKLFTSSETIEKIGAALKVVKGLTPKQRYQDQTTAALAKLNSVNQAGFFTYLESLGNPVNTATSYVQNAAKQALPSPDITAEEVEILRTQHIKNGEIDVILAESYRLNAERRQRLVALEQEIKEAEAKLDSLKKAEKERVKALLLEDCQRQKQRYEENN